MYDRSHFISSRSAFLLLTVALIASSLQARVAWEALPKTSSPQHFPTIVNGRPLTPQWDAGPVTKMMRQNSVQLLYQGRGVCGGLAIGVSCILTARHCVKDRDVGKMSFEFPEHEKNPVAASGVSRSHDKADIAIVKLKSANPHGKGWPFTSIADTRIPEARFKLKAGQRLPSAFITGYSWVRVGRITETTVELEGSGLHGGFMSLEGYESETDPRYGNLIRLKQDHRQPTSNSAAVPRDSGGPVFYGNVLHGVLSTMEAGGEETIIDGQTIRNWAVALPDYHSWLRDQYRDLNCE